MTRSQGEVGRGVWWDSVAVRAGAVGAAAAVVMWALWGVFGGGAGSVAQPDVSGDPSATSTQPLPEPSAPAPIATSRSSLSASSSDTSGLSPSSSVSSPPVLPSVSSTTPSMDVTVAEDLDGDGWGDDEVTPEGNKILDTSEAAMTAFMEAYNKASPTLSDAARREQFAGLMTTDALELLSVMPADLLKGTVEDSSPMAKIMEMPEDVEVIPWEWPLTDGQRLTISTLLQPDGSWLVSDVMVAP